VSIAKLMHASYASTLWLLAALLNAQQAEYVGSQVCKTCHPAQFAGQSESGHAKALRRTTDHPFSGAFRSRSSWQRTANYVFEFSTSQEGISVTAFDNEKRQTMALPVEWAFGAGNHAVTFASHVTRDVYLEHSFSYYPASRSFDLTPGHRHVPPESLPLAMGVLHKVIEPGGGMQHCFGCHSTGPVRVTANSEIQPTELGVRCEVCHGPGQSHQRAAMAGSREETRKAIRNPGKLNAGQINELCGTCHRFPGNKFAINWNAVWNVRHQPPYLQQSRCFQNSQGALSCFTCHEPHAALRQADSSYYAKKCAGCHNAQQHPPASVCRKQANTDCVSCHMPKVAVTAQLQFVNHWIGVYDGKQFLTPAKK
jgi:hypothetical protein